MKKIVTYITIIIFLTSCSQQRLLKLTAKTPKIEYQKPNNYLQLNKYQKDAVYLTELVKQTYPRLNSKITDSNYLIESHKLIANLSEIKNDLDFDIQIRKFIALLKDGHTNTTINFSSEEKFHLYLFKEKENWIIGNIDNSVDSTVIGSKIISVNGHPIKEIENLINNFECGENSFYTFEKFRWNLTSPKYWEAIGVINNNENLKFITSKSNKEYVFEIKRKTEAERYDVKVKESEYPFTKKQNDGYYYKVDKEQNFAYLQMNTSLDYVSIKSGISNYTNFLTRPIALLLLKKRTKDAGNFGLTLEALFKEIQRDSIKNLVIDLRNNTGGDVRPGKQLIWYLTEKENIQGFTQYLNVSEYFKIQIKKDYKEYNTLYEQKYRQSIPKGEINLTNEFYNQPYFNSIVKEDSPFLLDNSIPKFKGNIYVLIGPYTFSAGQVLATTIADNNLASIVGQPTGNKPTTQTGSSHFKLPNTKKIISISYLFMERPDISKNDEIALYPDVEIYQTLDDLINGRDKQFEYIMNKIKE